MATGTTSGTRAHGCCTIAHTATVEDYLKALFTLTSRGDAATTSGMAERLSVAPSSVTAMLHRLHAAGLVEQVAWGRVILTAHGLEHAQGVVRRHRLLETFLHEVLGISWDEVHDEAEVLEHHVSEDVEQRIDAVLGFPVRDPHGDPIPRAQGMHEEHGDAPLASCSPGDRFRVERVLDSDSLALRDLAELGIRPGVWLELEQSANDIGPMWVRAEGRPCVLSDSLVDLIHGRLEAREVAS